MMTVCVEWATWNGLRAKIDAVYEVWLKFLLVSVYLWGICRSQGRGGKSMVSCGGCWVVEGIAHE